MIAVCENFSGLNFARYDAVLIFISSHGDEGDIVYGVDGNGITVNNVVSKFKSNDSLANKPKLFFMQNCRGRYVDRGVDIVQADGPRTAPFRIPSEADVLVAFSTVDGYESYRDEAEGSWFISVLIDVLNKQAHDMNLTDLLIIVNKKVAEKSHRGKKQIPSFITTLRKPVYFVKRPREQKRGTFTPEL